MSDDTTPVETPEDGASASDPAPSQHAAPPEEAPSAGAPSEGEKSSEQILGEASQLQKESAEGHHAPGTVVLTLIFLLTFVIYYFANWKALADVWHVR